MSEKYGTEETKDVLALGLSLGMAVDKSLADGKIDWSDAANLVDVVRTAPAAISGITNVPNELKDLSAEEKAELMAWSKAEFDLRDDGLEATVEAGLGVGLAIANLVAKLAMKDEETGEPDPSA